MPTERIPPDPEGKARYFVKMGFTELTRGRLVSARVFVKLALAMDPKNPDVPVLLSRLSLKATELMKH